MLRHIFNAILLLVLSGRTIADERYSSVEHYMESATGMRMADYDYDLSSHHPTRGVSNVFGILKTKGDERECTLFVLLKEQLNGFRLAGSAPPFACPYKSYVEIILADGNDRFHLQINFPGACTSRTVYRFKERKGRWLVAGYDKEDCAFNVDDSIGIGRKTSVNFLTGQIIIERYKNDKLISTRKKRTTFPTFLLQEFNPWDERYVVE